jgi:hypothetical protein
MRRRELLFVALLGCSSPRSPVTPPAAHHWRVFDGDQPILELSDRPGPLISTAPLPPGQPPATHPFLSGTALDAGHEDQLHQLLERSHDVAEFRAALAAAGFRVVAE